MSELGDNPTVQLEVKLDRLCNGIEAVKERQDEMAEDIGKIKEAVFNPDEGLYARLRALEAWKTTSSKMLWTLFTSVIGLVCAFLLKTFP